MTSVYLNIKNKFGNKKRGTRGCGPKGWVTYGGLSAGSGRLLAADGGGSGVDQDLHDRVERFERQRLGSRGRDRPAAHLLLVLPEGALELDPEAAVFVGRHPAEHRDGVEDGQAVPQVGLLTARIEDFLAALHDLEVAVLAALAEDDLERVNQENQSHSFSFPSSARPSGGRCSCGSRIHINIPYLLQLVNPA